MNGFARQVVPEALLPGVGLDELRKATHPGPPGAGRPTEPAAPWPFIPVTNPIESTFATVRHRTKITRGPGSRAAGLAMAFKLIQAAQDRWRAVNGPHLVALVRAGATFVNGRLVERPDEHAQSEAA